MSASPFAELLAPLLPKVKRRWQYAKSTNHSTMSWEHPDMGKYIVGIEGIDVGHTKSIEGYSWSPVGVHGRMPSGFKVTFAANLDENVCLVLQARGNNLAVCTGNLPDLDVRVEWDGDRPKTRQRDKDNLDHFLVNADCVVVQLQTSFVTRHSNFFICNQELWALRVVEVPGKTNAYRTHEVNGKHYAAENLWDNQAYPGADFLLTNAVTGPKLIEEMLNSGLQPPFVETLPQIEWNPPPFPLRSGYMGAIVMWFNPNVGGKVLCEDGTAKFVPLKGIRSAKGGTPMFDGEFAIVTPKQPVLLQMQGKRNDAFAAIRPIA
jgi:hypothetical protein